MGFFGLCGSTAALATTLTIAAAPNDTGIGLRVVGDVSGAVAEFTVTADMPAATQLLRPRNSMNNDATAAAVAYDCSGIHGETHY